MELFNIIQLIKETSFFFIYESYQIENYDTLGISFWLKARSETIQRCVTNKCRWFFSMLFYSGVWFELSTNMIKLDENFKTFQKMHCSSLFEISSLIKLFFF